MTSPIVVSFYCGDARYRNAADLLRDDCVNLALDHDIVELPSAPEETWLDICRRKVGFFLEMHRKHRRPIFWLDADSRLLKRPALFDEQSSDLAGFLRGTRYLRDFDPLALPRFFAPFALYFNHTPAATAFLELMDSLEREYPEDASDDFFLQEAWLRHTVQLSILVLPPSLVAHALPARGDEVIYCGVSGNVPKYKLQAQQHAIPLFSSERRKAVLLHEAAASRKNGQIDEALVLYKAALAAGGHDAELAAKIARLTKHQIAQRNTDALCRQDAGSAPLKDEGK